MNSVPFVLTLDLERFKAALKSATDAVPVLAAKLDARRAR